MAGAPQQTPPTPPVDAATAPALHHSSGVDCVGWADKVAEAGNLQPSPEHGGGASGFGAHRDISEGGLSVLSFAEQPAISTPKALTGPGGAGRQRGFFFSGPDHDDTDGASVSVVPSMASLVPTVPEAEPLPPPPGDTDIPLEALAGLGSAGGNPDHRWVRGVTPIISQAAPVIPQATPARWPGAQHRGREDEPAPPRPPVQSPSSFATLPHRPEGFADPSDQRRRDSDSVSAHPSSDLGTAVPVHVHAPAPAPAPLPTRDKDDRGGWSVRPEHIPSAPMPAPRQAEAVPPRLPARRSASLPGQHRDPGGVGNLVTAQPVAEPRSAKPVQVDVLAATQPAPPALDCLLSFSRSGAAGSGSTTESVGAARERVVAPCTASLVFFLGGLLSHARDQSACSMRAADSTAGF